MSSPSVTTEPPLPQKDSSIGDDAPLRPLACQRAERRKVGNFRGPQLGRIQRPLIPID